LDHKAADQLLLARSAKRAGRDIDQCSRVRGRLGWQPERRDLERALVDGEGVVRLRPQLAHLHAERNVHRRRCGHGGIRKIREARAGRIGHDVPIDQSIAPGEPVAVAVSVGAVLGALGARITARVAATETMGQLMREDMVGQERRVCHHRETPQRVGIVARLFENVGNARRRWIGPILDQANEVGAGGIADRVNLIHAAVVGFGDRSEHRILPARRTRTQLIARVARFRDLHQL